jgi:hypothetical protein
MQLGVLIIPGIAMIAFGVLGARKTILQRAFEKAAPVGRDSAEGRYVKVTGVVKTVDSVVVREPLLNQACAWFSIRAHKYNPLDDANSQFKPIGSKRSVAPFLLVNDVGTFLIEPARARMYVPYKDEHWEGRYRAKMASLSAGDRVIAIGDVQRLDPPMDGRVFELVRTPEAPLIVTTFTEGEIQRRIAKGRVWSATLVVVGVGLLLVALLA